MLLLSFTFRHLRRHWRLNLAVLLGLTLATALLASLPTYAAAVAARGLQQSLQDASPIGRNLFIQKGSDQLGAGLYGMLQDALGDLIGERIQVRERYVGFNALLVETLTEDGQVKVQAHQPPRMFQSSPDHRVWLWTLDGLKDNVRLVQGDMPGLPPPGKPTENVKLPPLQAVIGLRTAEKTGYDVGTRLRVKYNSGLELHIVGIVEPLDPGHDRWWSDLRPFGIRLKPLGDPSTVDPGEELITLPLIISPETMTKYIPYHQVTWRVLMDHEKITVNNAQEIESELIKLQLELKKSNTQLTTRLTEILADYRGQLSQVRMSVLLLTAQAFIFVLYTLAMLTSFSLDRSQSELATLSGRGATALQITFVFAVQNLLLAALAALFLGPLLAQRALLLWSQLSGEAVFQKLPPDAYRLAAAAAVFGWLALVLPVYPATRRNLLDWQLTRARPARLAKWQKLYLDLFLLVLGGMAYWQLGQSGSFVLGRFRDNQLADPVLLLGPSLLLIAVAMLSLRVFPYLLQFVAWLFQRTRGVLFPVGLARLARDPVKPSRVVILISLTAGLALFTSSFGVSLARSQKEMAHYLAGSDLRIVPEGKSIESLAELPGVLSASQAFRALARTQDSLEIQLFALDPATFDQVTRYPSGLTNLKMSSVVNVLAQPKTGEALPAIFSHAALPIKKTVGDDIPFNLAGNSVTLRVQGSIANFPTLSGAFIIVSLPDLSQQIDVQTYGLRASGSYEAWLEVDPAQHTALVNHPDIEGCILDDAQVQFRSLHADALSQGTQGAFQLNTLTLALLSVMGFLLVHYFAAQQRVVEFSVLRALGLSTRQLLALLSTEGVLVISLGLLTGTVIGYGLSQSMVTYLSRALTESLAGVTIRQTLIDWPAVAQLYVVLIVFYALAILLLMGLLIRVGVHRALRMGDE